MSADLREQLLSYSWLQSRLDASDIHTLIADCQAWLHGKTDEPIRLLESALSMSVSVLEQDKLALAHQLAGRLSHYYSSLEEIKTLIDSLIPPKNSLFPMMTHDDPLNPVGIATPPPIEHDGWVGGVVKLGHKPLWERKPDTVIPRTSHEARVVGLAELPNGHILSWSMDKTLRVWTKSGEPITTLRGHDKWIDGALITADGHILSWSGDATLRLWGLDGTPIAVMRGHDADINGVLITADSHILSWSGDATLRLWGLDGTPIAVMRGHDADIYGATILKDGRILSWGKDKTLRIWSQNGMLLSVLAGHEDIVIEAIILTDGQILSRSGDNTLRLWDAHGLLVSTLIGHTDWASGMCELADGRILSWGYDDTIRLWTQSGEVIAILDESYEGDFIRISRWAHDNGFDADTIYPTKTYPILLGQFRLRPQWDKLAVYHGQVGDVIHTFYGDARIHSLLVVDDLVIIGDRIGRVIFLRWIG